VLFKLYFSRTTGTIQNMYTYHCHGSKHVHVSLSQFKTYTRTTVTVQNMYTYHCHSSKHVHVPLSQFKTYTRTNVTVQNMYTYLCHSSKHVHVRLGTANIDAYFQSCGLLGQRCGNLQFRSCCLSNLARLDHRGESVLIFEQ
jgi:hypothetical protein